ncbi:MAG: hypothetical protein ACI9F9_000813 [Candidatus Paceibacteria bacterium]|jgi:hypothetical protein
MKLPKMPALPLFLFFFVLSSLLIRHGSNTATAQPVAAWEENANTVVWEGESGPGKGKHIVFISGDHEYRGEESLPALARILAKSYGFKCTFIVTTNEESGEIEPGSDHITNLEALKTADLMVVFLRFQSFADDQMRHIDDYLNSGRPVIGLRTSTHAFKGIKGEFARYNEGYKGHGEVGQGAGDNWKHGFGEEILGEHWVGHFGDNHRQSSNLILEPSQLGHAILRGVKKAHAVCGGYVGHPVEGSTTLARGQILDGMTPDSPPATNERQKMQHAVAWVRTYQSGNPNSRVFTTTHGASEDLLSADFRRMLINAHFWCLGMEESIQPDGPIEFIGPYHPTTFDFGGYRRGVKPADIAGYDAPIYDPTKGISDPPEEEDVPPENPIRPSVDHLDRQYK